MFSKNQCHANLLKNAAVVYHPELWSCDYVTFNRASTWVFGFWGSEILEIFRRRKER